VGQREAGDGGKNRLATGQATYRTMSIAEFPSLHDMWHDTDAVRPTTAKGRNPASGFRPLLPFESLQCCFCLPKPPLVFPAPGVYPLDSGKRAVILT